MNIVINKIKYILITKGTTAPWAFNIQKIINI